MRASQVSEENAVHQASDALPCYRRSSSCRSCLTLMTSPLDVLLVPARHGMFSHTWMKNGDEGPWSVIAVVWHGMARGEAPILLAGFKRNSFEARVQLSSIDSTRTRYFSP